MWPVIQIECEITDVNIIYHTDKLNMDSFLLFDILKSERDAKKPQMHSKLLALCMPRRSHSCPLMDRFRP